VKLMLILIAAIVGVALAVPSASSAQLPPPPTQDSVSLTEGPGEFDGVPVVLGLNATSGRSGENPTGEVILAIAPNLIDVGPVTCLAVSGNSATLNFESQVLLGQIVTLQVVDDNPDTISIHVLGRAASDCSAPPPGNINPLSSGDITVVDAQPLPTTKDQCMNGGWEQLGFANQGQCIAFVNHGP
jgi:hypothetical protein